MIIIRKIGNFLFNSGVLIVRGMVMAMQQSGKRVITAQKDDALAATFSAVSAVENLIFILLYGGLHIVSRDIALVSDTKREVGAIYQRGIVLGSVLLSFFIAPICLLTPPYFRLTKQPGIVQQNSNTYVLYALIAYFFDMLYRTQARTVIGLSMPLSTLAADTVEVTIDVGLAYYLVNYTELGVNACAIAYAVSAAITAIGFAGYLHCRADLAPYALHQRHAMEWLKMKKMLISGLQVGWDGSFEALSLVLVTTLCGLSGISPLIGIQAAAAFSVLVGLAVAGASEAASVIMGNALRDDSNQFQATGKMILWASGGFAAFCAGSAFLFSQSLAQLFVSSDDSPHLSTAVIFLQIQAIIELMNSLRNAGKNVLMSASDTRFPFLLSVACLFVLNSIAALCSALLFKENPVVTYGAQLLGYALVAAGMVARCRYQFALRSTVWGEMPKRESPRNTEMLDELPVIISDGICRN